MSLNEPYKETNSYSSLVSKSNSAIENAQGSWFSNCCSSFKTLIPLFNQLTGVVKEGSFSKI